MAGFTKKFVKRELIITMKSHKTNFPTAVFTLLPCVYRCLSPVACPFVRVCAYIPSPGSKNVGQGMGPIWQAQLGESLVMLIGPSWEPNLVPYWAPNVGPSGKENVCLNFALTVGKFVFSNSGNLRAKANPPKPRSCPKRPFGQ